MERDEMTRRMAVAIANPHVDVLGHCTGRLVQGKGRPESEFDPELIFTACQQFGTAVEINSRPERLDPPKRLLRVGPQPGRPGVVDTHAHAPRPPGRAGQATYTVLNRANEAAPPFRAGLTTAAAAKSIRVLHQLLGSSAVALTNETDLLAWDGVADHHGLQASLLAAEVVASGRSKVVPAAELSCTDPYCAIRSAVI